MTLFFAALLASTIGSYPAEINDPYVPGQLIVQLAPECRGRVNPAIFGRLDATGLPEIDRISDRWQVTSIEKLIRDPRPSELAQKHGLDLLYTFKAPASVDVIAMMKDYAASPLVAYAHPNIIMALDEVPNDPQYGNQWHLAKMMAPAAWEISHGDSTVVVGVVDDGVDYTHPDLAANLWVNPAEDINHNGRFDPQSAPDGDMDGVDDDQNGYVDDVCGYDFVNDDGDPMPVGTDDHGTHCLGNVAAVTNNGVGVASIGWGCRAMALKAGQGGSVYMDKAIRAIYYSVEKSCWVTSHSYGGDGPYPGQEAAMQYAWDAGAIVCAAAGNDGVQTRHYPGAFAVCVAVAASDQNDHRSLWPGNQGSNYGDWIEVAAPGTGILSTVPVSGGSYAQMDGTSMATPITAGLLALMKAGNPSLSNQQAIEALFNTCDTMPDDDYRNGLLGFGRINAMKALAIDRRCWLNMTGQRLVDPNGNGIAEPDEEIGLSLTLANEAGWRTATGVTTTLSCSDPDITITKATAGFPDIPGGESRSCTPDSMIFRVSANAVPHMVTVKISKSATPASLAPDEYYTLQVGMPRVLLVDDFATDNIAKWYRWSCDSLRVLYDQYSVSASGAPSADTLRHYPVVIWFTGNDSTSLLSSACQTALSGYLDAGHNLFIAGQNIGQAIGGTGFYTNYLKAQFSIPSSGKLFALGLPGDPLGDDDTMAFGGSGGAGNGRSNDGVKPTGGSFGSIIYKDYADTTIYAAVRYAGSFRMVYFAAPFEALGSSTTRYVQKWTMLRRIMDYFGERLPGAIEESPRSTTSYLPLAFGRNPVRERAEIAYSVSRNQTVSIRVYDTQGRTVKDLYDGTRAPGSYQAIWNLTDESNRPVANGIYFCSVSAGSESRSGKLLVTR